MSPLDLGILVGIVAILAVAAVRGLRRRAQERRSTRMTHAVILSLPLSDASFGTPEERDRIRQLGNRLTRAIVENEAGEFDGDEFGEGGCTLYMYGWDADRLFRAIRPVLEGASLPAGSRGVRRYGPAGDPGAKEERFTL